MNVKQHKQQHVFTNANGISTGHLYVKWCYVQSVQTLVTVTCSGGLLVLGGTAPEVRHCTGGRATSIYYSATMLVPLASDVKDRNQRSAWSRPF